MARRRLRRRYGRSVASDARAAAHSVGKTVVGFVRAIGHGAKEFGKALTK